MSQKTPSHNKKQVSFDEEKKDKSIIAVVTAEKLLSSIANEDDRVGEIVESCTTSSPIINCESSQLVTLLLTSTTNTKSVDIYKDSNLEPQTLTYKPLGGVTLENILEDSAYHCVASKKYVANATLPVMPTSSNKTQRKSNNKVISMNEDDDDDDDDASTKHNKKKSKKNDDDAFIVDDDDTIIETFSKSAYEAVVDVAPLEKTKRDKSKKETTIIEDKLATLVGEIRTVLHLRTESELTIFKAICGVFMQMDIKYSVISVLSPTHKLYAVSILLYFLL